MSYFRSRLIKIPGKLKYNILYWLDNARYIALPQSVLPALVAIFIAGGDPNFSLIYGLLALFGVMFAHLSMNLFDDYFDFQTGGIEVRDMMNQEGIRARIAKSPYLSSKEVTPRQLFMVAVVFSLVALAFGLAIFIKQGLTCLYIALLAGFLGYFYSGRPLRLCYHGLGELVIGIVFGPLLMSGVYYASCGHFSTPIWYISAVMGLLVVNIVYTHSIMDFSADRGNRKKTLATILGNSTLNLMVSAIFNFFPYLIILSACHLNVLPWYYLSVFLFLPLSIYLYYLIYEFVYHPEKEFQRHWWLGPLDRWQEIREAGLDWFLLRWYTARNITQFFSIVIIICAIISYHI